MAESSSHMFNIPPINDRALIGTYESQLAAADSALHVARQQLVCLKIEDLFEEHPELLSARMISEPLSDDGGGMRWFLHVQATVDGSLSAGGAPMTVDQLEDEARSILGEWAALVHGELITRDDHARKIGVAILGASGFAQWQAFRERGAMEAAAPDTAPKGKGGPRV